MESYQALQFKPWLSSQPTESTTLLAMWVCHLGSESDSSQVSCPSWCLIDQRWTALVEPCKIVDSRARKKKKYVALSYWAWSFVIQQQIIGKQPHPKGSLQPSLQYPGGLRPHVWVWDWGRYAKPKIPSQRFWFNSDQVTLTCSQVILTHLHLEQLEIMRLGFRYLCVFKTP